MVGKDKDLGPINIERLIRPQGSLSEFGLRGLIEHSGPSLRLRRLKDVRTRLRSGARFDPRVRAELEEVEQQFIEGDGGKKRKFSLSPADITIEGVHYKVIRVTGPHGNTGFAPIPSLVVNEILAEGMSHSKKEVRLEVINGAIQRYDPRLEIEEVIALTKDAIADLRVLFGYNRDLEPERWYLQLKPTKFKAGYGISPISRRSRHRA